MRSKTRRSKPEVDGQRFWMAPHDVLNSCAYVKLSHTARTLLVEFGRQLGPHNNGWLIATERLLIEERHILKSSSTLARAKKELVEAGFVHETVKGHRPNKASRFAVTWRPLDKPPAGKSYDAEATLFRRAAYATLPMAMARPTRDELYRRWRNQVTTPPNDVDPHHIAPGKEVDRPATTSVESAVRP
jgi:hypothetical protein